MVVPVEPSPHARTAGTLQILVTTDLFRGALDLAAAVELLQASRDRTYAAGDVICGLGDAVDSLCVIRSGTVLLERHGMSRALSYCDYFGEAAVAERGATPHARSDATARAASSVEVVEIPRSALHFLLDRHPLLSRRVLRRSTLMSSAASASWRAIGANSVFAQFSLSQVTRLQSVMNPTQTRTRTPTPTRWRSCSPS
jgi:CRP-like cAMP-binding protein